MLNFEKLEAKRVFHYFEKITQIPHGSEDMTKISDFCVNFAKENSLEHFKDEANNVLIYKNATPGYENAEPIILQGHLDMVCQKTEDCEIDFLKDGLEIFVDGDFIKAKNTTLGADNGIAVAMILAILESKSYSHPKIEALFTTDEEIGMIGAIKLDTSKITGKKMLNLDLEDDSTMTVSCAGGNDFKVTFPYTKITREGTEFEIILKGLRGGHSGVEINKGIVNSNILAGRVLNYLKGKTEFSIISINGGNKTNVITSTTKIKVCAKNKEEFLSLTLNYFELLKQELKGRENDFCPEINELKGTTLQCINEEVEDALIYALVCIPNGVVDMSAEIESLVETSLNLGILETTENNIILHTSLRSNKASSMEHLTERIYKFFSILPCKRETYGYYPCWEFKSDSSLQELYKNVYKQETGNSVKVEAIHAGLECGVLSSKIDDLDCISIGPTMFDVHSTKERLSISSTEKFFKILLKVLENLK